MLSNKKIRIFIKVKFNIFKIVNAERFAYVFRYYYSSEFIYLFNKSSCFHNYYPPKFFPVSRSCNKYSTTFSEKQ